MERCTVCGTDGRLAKLFPAPGLRLALCEGCLEEWYAVFLGWPGAPPERRLARVREARRPAANALTHLIVRG